ncbi:MAG: hypothetical protein ACYCXF_00170 [Thermoleophilia bacterium]
MNFFNNNGWPRLRKFATMVLVAGSLAAAVAGCGSAAGAGTTGSDSTDSLIPDYQKPIQQAKDVASQAQQQQKQADDNARQLLQSP